MPHNICGIGGNPLMRRLSNTAIKRIIAGSLALLGQTKMKLKKANADETIDDEKTSEKS